MTQRTSTVLQWHAVSCRGPTGQLSTETHTATAMLCQASRLGLATRKLTGETLTRTRKIFTGVGVQQLALKKILFPSLSLSFNASSLLIVLCNPRSFLFRSFCVQFYKRTDSIGFTLAYSLN